MEYVQSLFLVIKCNLSFVYQFLIYKLKYFRPYWNTGFTTFLSYRKKLLSIEAVIVTVHEIGHNFGAFHDDIEECTPGVVSFIQKITKDF